MVTASLYRECKGRFLLSLWIDKLAVYLKTTEWVKWIIRAALMIAKLPPPHSPISIRCCASGT